ncbi:hypothetical protein H2201_008599 [Coniosporium apollinis]|uniref:Cytochrome P450 oxidoreductase n=2 Tax=Coniosporium TaxID=2810619 RepID=A0ABQ9NFT2_9PEZI|nr:hypothetical protein H2199_009175 [Cladosporium sp. JES 115]KAJ9656267.1 hypothetical protein H2201_008599 [Coniosporium apollinis]
MGPNFISLTDPRLIKTIYSTRGNYAKSDFYSVNDVLQDGHIIQNVFSTRSNAFHAKYMRPIQKLYSMSGILSLEPLADTTISIFCRRLEELFVDRPNTCDIGDWLLYYAWDVVGEVTFSQPIGFLEEGTDINDMLVTAEKALDYFAVITQMPKLDHLLDKNPLYRLGPPSFGAAAGYCAQRMMERIQHADTHNHSQPDFLDHFLEMKKTYPDVVDNKQVIGYLLINILAGADTTAITLRAIIYYLLKNPSAMAKLYAELDAANLPLPASYDSVRNLPYLSAVLREAMRMHPAVGMIMERIVPSGGLALPDGRFVAPGTIVGMNPWVVHRNQEIFGADADRFNPDRWLKGEDEDEETYRERLKRMKDADLTFGAGNRVCLGQNLALMECNKVVATLFSRYNFGLEDPKREWNIQNSWFVRQTDIRIRITRHNKATA